MIIGKTSKSCKQMFLFPDCDSFCVLLNCIYLLISIITLTWYIFTIQLLIKRDSNKAIDKNRKLIVYFSIYLVYLCPAKITDTVSSIPRLFEFMESYPLPQILGPINARLFLSRCTRLQISLGPFLNT